MLYYSLFHIKDAWSVHSFNGDYLSILSAQVAVGTFLMKYPVYYLFRVGAKYHVFYNTLSKIQFFEIFIILFKRSVMVGGSYCIVKIINVYDFLHISSYL